MSVRFTSVLLAGILSLAFVGCGETDTEPTPPSTTNPTCSGGKCDGDEDRINLLSSLLILDRENLEGELETFRLFGDVADDFYFDVEDGHTLKVDVWAHDGASDPTFTIQADLVYYEDGAGAFVSEEIDVSELLPYLGLRISVRGELGEQKIDQIFEFLEGSTEGVQVEEEEREVDYFAEARDVTKALIYIDEDLIAPSYSYPPSFGSFGLGGTEFWQKWEGGLNPTYSYTAGTNAGQKCMYASAIRFEAIMSDPPESMVQLLEETKWSGRFFNWNDDFSHETSFQRPRGAALWAWRTSLIKWISQTGKDGACHLPTYEKVDRAAQNCLRTGASGEGEIEGCQG